MRPPRRRLHPMMSFDRFGNTADVTNLTVFSVSPVEATSGCNSPAAQPACRRHCGAHTVNVTFQSFHEAIPLWVDPSLVLSQIVLSGGPAGGQPAGRDRRHDSAIHRHVHRCLRQRGIRLWHRSTITPDGTCDRDALTCTPAAPGLHTVTAESLDGDVQSSPLTFTAVAADHLQLHGGSSSIAFGRETSPYQIEGFDTDGYDLGRDGREPALDRAGRKLRQHGAHVHGQRRTQPAATTRSRRHTPTALIRRQALR